jgi:hypothetical protein
MLADRGLVFSATTVTDLEGNVSGAERRAFACADGSLVAVDADLVAKPASTRGDCRNTVYYHAAISVCLTVVHRIG